MARRTFEQSFENVFRSLLPSPLVIAILLTVLTFTIAFTIGDSTPTALIHSWFNGLWDTSMLAFTVQMMLILVLGHTLALSPAVNRLINSFLPLAKSGASAAFIISFTTILVAYFNWGLALIYGAIISRAFAKYLSNKQLPFSYPLLGACGYLGLMVWHGGLSASAPLKAAEQDHLIQISGVSDLQISASINETLFGTMNITGFVMNLLLLPTLAYVLAGIFKGNNSVIITYNPETKNPDTASKYFPAEKLDYKKWPTLIFGAFILLVCTFLVIDSGSLNFLSLNFVNFLLLGLCLVFHKNFNNFSKASEEGIISASGILIQFPLYFGIMAIMRDEGIIDYLSNTFAEWSTSESFPIFTFFSAAIVNIFVPSGGGQWAIQGPLIISTCQELGTSLPKTVMALSYGDQITNMLQPFWALPLLGITGLKARDIIPFTLTFMLAGILIALFLLILF